MTSASSSLGDPRDWIALNLTGLGPKTLLRLLEHFPSPRAVWEAPLNELKAIPGIRASAELFVEARERVDVERELQEIERFHLSVLTLADERYPQPLRAIPDPPPVLYCKGSYEQRDELAIAVVGTRKPSAYGRMVAEKLGRELGTLGFTIVSGLALGIDTAAHRGALKAGARTLAVLGGGFAHLYPRQNRRLAEEIAQQGAVLSEFAVQTPPDRWTFPRRNRVISGLVRGVIVIEAPERSGALITAKCALDQGREVFAVPGSITHEGYQGSHKLIQQGAKLVTSVEDVIEEFVDLRETLRAAGLKPEGEAKAKDLSPLEARVYETLEFEPLHFNDVVERAKVSPTDASYALLQLVMKDLVKELEGKRYVKLP
jgi:DNA processing protein